MEETWYKAHKCNAWKGRKLNSWIIKFFQVQIIDSYRELDKVKGTIISLLPSILNRIINDDQYIKILSSYRAIVLGGEPADKKLLLKCIKLKLNIFISYGMTETCSGIAGTSINQSNYNKYKYSPFKNVYISVDNLQICIKSPTVMKKYYKSSSSMTSFTTGDLGDDP